MKTEEFDFDIGSSTMPTDPIELRGKSREQGKMIVLHRASESVEHSVFAEFANHLRAGDLLVLNDSYMLSNTLSLAGEGAAPGQVIVYGHEPDGTCIVEVRPRELATVGAELRCGAEGQLRCTLLESYPDHLWKARFDPPEQLVPTLEAEGVRSDETIPLDASHWTGARAAYRSVYAKKPGSLEIPSAGLHFSTELLESCVAKGVELAFITLHVGATEIVAVRHIDEEQIENHEVREEYFEVDATAAEQINRALAEGRRIVAVGTTVVRTLESVVQPGDGPATVAARSGWTDLYIYPGFEFRVVGAILTNLHRPRSSHIVLTAAFAGKDFLMRSYDELLAAGGYEFDMFGDSMLIL